MIFICTHGNCCPALPGLLLNGDKVTEPEDSVCPYVLQNIEVGNFICNFCIIFGESNPITTRSPENIVSVFSASSIKIDNMGGNVPITLPLSYAIIFKIFTGSNFARILDCPPTI